MIKTKLNLINETDAAFVKLYEVVSNFQPESGIFGLELEKIRIAIHKRINKCYYLPDD